MQHSSFMHLMTVKLGDQISHKFSKLKIFFLAAMTISKFEIFFLDMDITMS